jgi:hypothetical protein
MPECPNCQTSFETGERFCKECGSPLAPAEEVPVPCPRCGLGVSPQQDFCHECGVSLKNSSNRAQATETAPEVVIAERIQPAEVHRGIRPWIVGVLTAAGLIIIGGLALMIWFGRLTPAPSPLSQATSPQRGAQSLQTPTSVTPAPPASPSPSPSGTKVLGPPFYSKPTVVPVAPAPVNKTVGLSGGASPHGSGLAPEPELSLKEQLEELLLNLRRAQQNKEIAPYLACYSPAFPDLDKKRQDTVKKWEAYDYPRMAFNLENIIPLGSESATARVTWDLETRNQRTGEIKIATLTYVVGFALEQRQWRIKSLEKIKEEEKEEEE